MLVSDQKILNVLCDQVLRKHTDTARQVFVALKIIAELVTFVDSCYQEIISIFFEGIEATGILDFIEHY
jgi:predicted nucleic-acid-binding protein